MGCDPNDICEAMEIIRGDTITKTFPFTDDAGDPIDNTGYTARIQFRQERTLSSLLELTHSAGIALGGADGLVNMTMTGVQSEALAVALPPKTGNYDVELTSPSGVVTTISYGDVEILPDVSRADISI